MRLFQNNPIFVPEGQLSDYVDDKFQKRRFVDLASYLSQPSCQELFKI